MTDQPQEFGRTTWTGTAAGGPLDGSEISVECSAGMQMRALHVVVAIGEDPKTADWHLYALAKQELQPERGLVSTFAHAGTAKPGSYPPEVEGPGH